MKNSVRYGIVATMTFLVVSAFILPSSAIDSNCQSRTCYWIGGSGNFSDVFHWIGHQLPGQFDKIIFNPQSGTGNAVLDMNFTSGPVTFSGSMIIVISEGFTWTLTTGISPPFRPDLLPVSIEGLLGLIAFLVIVIAGLTLIVVWVRSRE